MTRAVSALSLVAATVLSGCSTVAYYAQAIQGQLQINAAGAPIDEVLADPAITPRAASQIALVQRARAFASRELGLPDNGSYRRYADLHRPFAVWNVFAAPAWSVTPLEWCFPFAGCVAYRGYFSEAAAKAEGTRLRDEGFDVFVAGVPAYSTLGWFDDPVMNTFINYPEPELVGLIFHELAHQQVYAPGDATFNESFATAVEQEGVRRWFEATRQPAGYAAYQLTQARKQAFIALLLRTRDRLAAVYAEPAGLAHDETAKAEVLREASLAYQQLKQSWGGYAAYDRWFDDGPLNNAKLASVALYADRVPAFQAMLAQAEGDLPGFYHAVRALAALPEPERLARLSEAASYKLAATPQEKASTP